MKTKIQELSDAKLLEKCKENKDLLKELQKRFPKSILVDLETNQLLSFIGIKRIKEYLKEVN